MNELRELIRRRSTNENGEDGIALVVVLTVLFMLFVIATPFVVSSKNDYRIATSAASQYRARALADAAVEMAKHRLEATHRGVEASRGDQATPYWDTASETAVDPHPKDWADLIDPDGGRYLANPRGDMWNVSVRDEQAWLNADTMPPYLWGAFVGRTRVASAGEANSKRLEVESTAGFPPRGEIVVDGDVLPYRRIDGGAFLEVNLTKPYAVGTTVLAKAAYELATWNYQATPGQYRTFPALTSVKEVSGFGRPIAENELDGVLSQLTRWGRREAASNWMQGQTVIADVDPQDFEDTRGQPVRVLNPDFFNPGTVVRLTEGDAFEYHVVRSAQRQGSAGVVNLLEPVGQIFRGRWTTISAELRHPVNVNACSRDVLVLLMDGVEYAPSRGRGSRDDRRVSTDLATEVADTVIRNRPLEGPRHLADLLKRMFHLKRGQTVSLDTVAGGPSPAEDDTVEPGSAEMTEAMALAILQNALNPCFWGLRQSTMPFAYDSGDRFTAEVMVSVNDAGGTELARRRVRETFLSAPSRPLTFRQTTQRDFERSIVAARSGRYVETHPWPMSFYTSPTSKPELRLLRYTSNFADPEKAGFFPDPTEGDVRLQPARLTTTQGGDYEEHFDGQLGRTGGASGAAGGANASQFRTELITPEGYPLTEGAFPLPIAGTGAGGGGAGAGGGVAASSPNSGTVTDDVGLLPFALEFYMRPESFGSNPYFFSLTGDDPDTDYVNAYYDAASRSFRLDVHDITLDDPNSNRTNAVQVRWTPQGALEDDTFFHIGAHVGSTFPGDASLHVDGFKRGESNLTTTLSSGLSDTSTSFSVEDVEGLEDWPTQGAFRVGTEIVEATRNGTDFTILNPSSFEDSIVQLGRAARGSRLYSHPSGQSVSPFGYSLLLRTSTDIQGIALPSGGGQLASDLGPFNVMSLVGNSMEVIDSGDPAQGVPPTVVELYDPSMDPDLTLMPYGEGTAQDIQAFQTSGGYALVVTVSPLRGQGSNLMVEMVRYQGVQTTAQGGRLTGVQAVPNPPNPELQGNPMLGAGGASFILSTTRIQHDTANISPMTPGRLTAVIPISVHLTDTTGYRIPAPAPNGSGETEPEFVQIGSPSVNPTFGGIEGQRLEWMRYYHVDEQNGMLLCDDVDRLERAVGHVAASVGSKPDLLRLNFDGLWFRTQEGTHVFDTRTPLEPGLDLATSDRVVPVFRTSTLSSRRYTSAGYGEDVTLVGLDGTRSLQVIAWASPRIDTGQSSSAQGGIQFSQQMFERDLVAFVDNVAGDVVQETIPAGGLGDRRRFARICRFPSGELPRIRSNGVAYVGSDSSGQPRGGAMIDEVRLRGQRPEHYVVWDQGVINPVSSTPPDSLPVAVSDSDDEIPIAQTEFVLEAVFLANENPELRDWIPDGRKILAEMTGNLDQDAGLVQIGDEIIAYRDVGAGQSGFPVLRDCIRGFMGTEPSSHGYGEPIVFLDWVVVSELTNAIDDEGADLVVEETRGFAPFGGTVLVFNDATGREVMHYTRAQGDTLLMPRRLEEDGGDTDAAGIFRGRYGTTPGSHDTGSIVMNLPFRYWDRYAPESDDPALAFYSFAVDEGDGFFDQLVWSHRFEQPGLGMTVACRLDDRLPWSTPVENAKGKLLVFDAKQGRGQRVENKVPLRVSGRGLEVRVFFRYLPNAFDPVNLTRHDWKETPHLLDIGVTYAVQPRVFRREILE